MIVAGVAGLAAGDRVGDAGLLVYEVATAVAALVLVTGLQPPSGDRVAGSLIELGQTPAGALRDAVARATRDPDVRVGLWDPDTGCYLAADGIEVDPARAGGERTAIVVWDGDGPVCVVILDAALARDPYLVASVEAAARAMAVNTRRTVEVMAHLRDLEESRRRLVEAADEERAVLQKELRAGLLADIVHLDTEVRRLGDRLPSPHLARGADHLERTTADLADVAAGLRPRELEQGLCPALARLAKSSPLPVRVVGDPGVLPPTIQLTVWFLCSEALTNAVKHARATYLDIALDRAGDRLTVSVRDNGVGGAELRLAGGLAGLRDRVASHRGRLEVTSGTSGTLLAAVLPLDDQRR
jgi:signal transduction histidine kinase